MILNIHPWTLLALRGETSCFIDCSQFCKFSQSLNNKIVKFMKFSKVLCKSFTNLFKNKRRTIIFHCYWGQVVEPCNDTNVTDFLINFRLRPLILFQKAWRKYRSNCKEYELANLGVRGGGATPESWKKSQFLRKIFTMFY